jgi:hypothetical protein
MDSYSCIATRAAERHLDVFGAFHPTAGDCAPEGCGTLILLGPREPGFWPHVTAAPEFTDGAADPLDRWSTRVITDLAQEVDATPLYPFGGPPWSPFIGWALRSDRAWSSPVMLLVHDRAGLLVSYRGALALPRRIALPAPPVGCPCDTCHRPCVTACPVGALDAAGYDTAACHDFLDTDAGGDCITQGCAVRRACPLSQTHGRLPAQSAYHMRVFHP